MGTKEGKRFIWRRKGVKLRDGIYTKQQGNVLTGRAIRHRGVSKDKGCYARVVIFGKNS